MAVKIHIMDFWATAPQNLSILKVEGYVLCNTGRNVQDYLFHNPKEHSMNLKECYKVTVKR
jgi:hypothetical protein